MHTKKKNKYLKRTNIFLYHFLYFFVRIWYLCTQKVHVQNTDKSLLTEPALILCTHPNFIDFAHIALATYPKRITFVVNRFYLNFEPVRTILNWIRVIPKRLFSPDTDTILKLIGAIKNGHIVAMMPEGRLSADGTNFKLANGTEKLVKMLGVDVFKIHTEGGYYANPRWAKVKRKAHVRINLEKILDKEQLKELSLEEVNTVLCQKMAYTDTLTEKLISCKDRTQGLDNIINYCPQCKSFLSLEAQNHSVMCKKCNYSVFMDEFCNFTSGEYKTIHEWYTKQGEAVLEKLKKEDFKMDVTVATLSKTKKSVCSIGEGVLSLSPKKLSYEGDLLHGKDVFGKEIKHIEAFVFSITKGLQLYIGEDLYFFLPVEDTKQMVFWSQAIDLLPKEN